MNREAAQACIARLSTKKVLAFDTETTGLSRIRDYAVILSLSDGIDRWAIWPSVMPMFWPLLQNPEVKLIGHNVNFDQWMLLNIGCDLDKYCKRTHFRVADTLILHALLEDDSPHDLKYLARRYLGIEMVPFNKVFGAQMRKRPLREILLDPANADVVCNYAALDAYATYKLFVALQGQLANAEVTDGPFKTLWEYYTEIELPFTKVLWHMERKGVLVNAERLLGRGPELDHKIIDIMRWFCRKLRRFDINLQSLPQMCKLFYEQLGYPVTSWTKDGKPQLTKVHLKTWAAAGCEYATNLLAYRTLVKELGTYVVNLSGMIHIDGRIHTTFKQAGARTGRLSSAAPNLTNQPGYIRDCYEAPPGKKLKAKDYDQLEMRILAHYCLHRCMVVSAPGRSREIGKIVQERALEDVYSYDVLTKKKVVERITHHAKNGRLAADAPYRGGIKPSDWTIIRHEGAPRRKLVLTSNHMIYGPDGKKRPVGSLRVGDYLLYEEPRIAGSQEQLLLGCLLGDGNFKRAGSKDDDRYFRGAAYYHCDAQKAYFNFKTEVLGPLSHSQMYDGRMHRGVVATSFQVENLARLMMVNGKRCPTRAALGKLDARGLAIWYCDDGTLGKDRRCSATKGFTASIANVRITVEELEFVNSHFGLAFNKWKTGFGVSGPAAESFFALVAKHIPPCMDYKLPAHWRGKFESAGWGDPVEEATPVRITEIRTGVAGEPLMGDGSGSTYDITVSRTHCYFAQGVLVSNSGDAALVDAIRSGKDVHSATAAVMYSVVYEAVMAAKERNEHSLPAEPGDKLLLGYRKGAKTIGFGLVYGMGAQRLAASLGISLEAAQALIDLYFSALPDVPAFFERAIAAAQRDLYCTTILGRRRLVPGIVSFMKSERKRAERRVKNSKIQGSASDIVKRAMVAIWCDDYITASGTEMLVQVHDEIVFEMPDAVVDEPELNHRIDHHMSYAIGVELKVPLTTSGKSGQNWADCK